MSIAIAEATYSFPNGEPQSPALVTVPASILEQILEEVQDLKSQVQDLQATVTRQDREIAALRLQIDALEARQHVAQKRISAISDVQDEICDKIDEHATALNTVWKAVKTTPATMEAKGEKTLKRIAKLEVFLKARGSGATFQEVEKILDISPSELTRLITKLDMRRYEIFARAGDNRQKVIRLKAQIR